MRGYSVDNPSYGVVLSRSGAGEWRCYLACADRCLGSAGRSGDDDRASKRSLLGRQMTGATKVAGGAVIWGRPMRGLWTLIDAWCRSKDTCFFVLNGMMLLKRC